MKEFTLKIELGNEAMETEEDVANVLVEVSKKVRSGIKNASILDGNGNSCGSYSFE